MKEQFSNWLDKQNLFVLLLVTVIVLALTGLLLGYFVYATYIIGSLLYSTGHWFILEVWGINTLAQFIRVFSKGDN